jgi:hypothetical protein
LVVYGFDPEEPLAEEIGENLAERNLEGVEAIKFRPKLMPDNVHHLPEEEAVRITLDGIKELKRYIKENYGKVGFVLDLHEYPLTIRNHEQFGLFFPAWNFRLERTLENFAKKYKKTFGEMEVLGSIPKAYPIYNSATIEYYSRVERNGKILVLTKIEGEKFAISLIDYLRKNYLRTC